MKLNVYTHRRPVECDGCCISSKPCGIDGIARQPRTLHLAGLRASGLVQAGGEAQKAAFALHRECCAWTELQVHVRARSSGCSTCESDVERYCAAAAASPEWCSQRAQAKWGVMTAGARRLGQSPDSLTVDPCGRGRVLGARSAERPPKRQPCTKPASCSAPSPPQAAMALAGNFQAGSLIVQVLRLLHLNNHDREALSG